MKYNIEELQSNKKIAKKFIEELHESDKFNKFKKDYLYNDETLNFNKLYEDFDKLNTCRDIETVEMNKISVNKKNNTIQINSVAYCHVEIGYGVQVRLYGEEIEEARKLDISDEDYETLQNEIESNPYNDELAKKVYKNNNCELCECMFTNCYYIEII